MTEDELGFDDQRLFDEVLKALETGLTVPASDIATKPLYHYTDARGLRGILEENQLRAHDVRFMNDSSELRYGFSLMKEVLQDLQAEGPPGDRLFRCFKRHGLMRPAWCRRAVGEALGLGGVAASRTWAR